MAKKKFSNIVLLHLLTYQNRNIIYENLRFDNGRCLMLFQMVLVTEY